MRLPSLWLTAALALIVGCGQSHACPPGASGIPGCTSVSDLSPEEVTVFCEWQFSLHENPGLQTCTTPEGSSFSVPNASVEMCRLWFDEWQGHECELTVLEQERCLAALLEDPCNARMAVCQDRPACPRD